MGSYFKEKTEWLNRKRWGCEGNWRRKKMG